jgi:hypothetical protein
MNRFLSSLRSRVLKNIELSRDSPVIEDYGDCKLWVGLEAFYRMANGLMNRPCWPQGG